MCAKIVDRLSVDTLHKAMMMRLFAFKQQEKISNNDSSSDSVYVLVFKFECALKEILDCLRILSKENFVKISISSGIGRQVHFVFPELLGNYNCLLLAAFDTLVWLINFIISSKLIETQSTQCNMSDIW